MGGRVRANIALAYLAKVGEGGRYWKYVKGLSVGIVCSAGNTEETYRRPITTGFESPLRAAASSSLSTSRLWWPCKYRIVSEEGRSASRWGVKGPVLVVPGAVREQRGVEGREGYRQWRR